MINITSIRDLEPEKLYLCRKIRYGVNKNFHRYVPVNFPEGCEMVTALVKCRDKFRVFNIFANQAKIAERMLPQKPS